MTVASQPPATPKTHYLFLEIVATVAQADGGGMSVRDIAKSLSLDPDVIAHCIALHVHLERQSNRPMPIPLPDGYWIPSADEMIDRVILEPPRSDETT